MKKLILFSYALLLAVIVNAQQKDFPKLTGPYLGQKLPGNEFVRYAPDIIPSDLFSSITVSPDGKEIYWATKKGVIMVVKSNNNIWSAPEVVSIGGVPSGTFGDDGAPVVSPDNKKLFFSSRRTSPLIPEVGYNWNTWFSERTPAGWGEPHPLPEVINNTGSMHGGVSIANSGTLYYGIFSQDRFSIQKCLLINGAYTTPEPMNELNDFGHVDGPFISPVESFIIFGKHEKLPSEPFASAGVFICFKGENGKYLFTMGGMWVSASFIEELRPKE